MGALETVSLLIAIAALALSGWTFWLTQLHIGKLQLTRPTILFFGWDLQDDEDVPKIMLRSALFSTSNRGQILENLYLVISHAGKHYEFPFWGYDGGEGMVRGSGLYVGQEGHIAYHHFNPLESYEDFKFGIGDYSIKIMGKTYGSPNEMELGSYNLNLKNGPETDYLKNHDGGVLWSWSPTKSEYLASASYRPVGKHEYSTWGGRS
jgi:hypothetical protein